MNKTRKLTLSALFGAMIFAATLFVQIPSPLGLGYAHIGDALIYITACILPCHYAVLASAVGSCLADAIVFPAYIIPTLIIKSLLVLSFTPKSEKIVTPRNIASAVLGGAIGVGGYFVAEWIMYASIYTAIANVVFNLLQPVVSLAVYLILGYGLDKVNFKKRFLR